MNAPDPELNPAATPPDPAQPNPPAAPPARCLLARELSPASRAFLAQMAENLRTHDPENPKGRLRLEP